MHRSKACGDKEDEGKRDEKISNNDSIEIRLHIYFKNVFLLFHILMQNLS